MGWNKSVKNIRDNLEAHIDNLNKKAARKVFKTVYDLSPIKTGRYKSNHLVSIGGPVYTFDARRRDYERWYNQGLQTINTSPRGASIYIQNCLPYSTKLEHGSSQQAPLGIYKIAYLQVQL